MANKHKIAEPIYQKIAVDIASKIAAGKYKVGEKIYGRSMLAAHYAVSPETIRRAMFMLQDVGIVAIESGSGAGRPLPQHFYYHRTEKKYRDPVRTAEKTTGRYFG